MKYFARLSLCLMLLGALVACGDSGSSDGGPDGSTGQDVALADSVSGADVAGPDALTDPDTPTSPDVGVDVVEPEADVVEDVAEALPPLPTQPPLAAPSDPLADAEVQSCGVYLEERCVDGQFARCEVYSTGDGTWVDEPAPLFRRALLYDRWRDLYNSPDGQAVDRDFAGEVLPGTPESEWGRPEHFAGYFGRGDGGIWTGWATVAAVLRYAQTGTEADYERMEQQVRDLVTMYEVTGIPGYMTRNHFLLLPEGAPNDPEHIFEWENRFDSDNHHLRAMPNPEAVPDLPAVYTEGVVDADGNHWQGTPMWQGRPSIDQNTGPMTALPMAYDLLRDEELKGRISHNLTCYLKRLQRIELINLQQNPQLVESLLAYFSVGELSLDEDDIDLTKLDRVVAYVHRQINSENEETFDRSCPDTVQLEPWRVIDATSQEFLFDLLGLVQDMDTGDERETQLDHFYFPSIRGGDAMHLMHLATMAYHFTGDDMYREFLHEELIGNIDTVGVMNTAGAFDLPKFCKKYYGEQIMFGPWWAFLHLLGDCPLRDELARAYHHEVWDKLLRPAGNVDFQIMYAGAVPPEMAPDREEALADALARLEQMGGNGGVLMGSPDDPQWLDDPRRKYTASWEGVLAALPDGVEPACPTQSEVDVCTAEIEILGIQMENMTGWRTHECTDAPSECPVGDPEENQCQTAQASHALPPHLRPHTDYLWQRNPFTLGRSTGVQGVRQFAGSDYSVPFWNARRYGFLEQGEGQVLAWRPAGTCE